ncbi:MAG: alpha/beta fold hydrolase, partial [Myxococcota bacterium]
MDKTRILIAALTVLSTACADDPSSSSGDTASTDPTTTADAGQTTDASNSNAETLEDTTPDMALEPDGPWTLTWEPCEVSAFGDQVVEARCAEVEAPLEWTEPDGETIALFTRHIPASGDILGRSVWLLTGGPGFSGLSLEPLGVLLSQQGFDVYVSDHRGTGRSTLLGCLDVEAPDSDGGTAMTGAEYIACQQEVIDTWGAERLSSFNSRNAAHDLGAFIASVHAPSEPVFVMGISYGTYLAHRYLQYYPEQSTGVIMDSICPPGGCLLSEQDRWYDRTAERFMTQVCATDPLCREKLGPDPWARVGEMHTMVRGGHCIQVGLPGATNSFLRGLLGSLLLNARLRVALPAVVYRNLRCSDEDRAALENLYFGGGGGGGGGGIADYSPFLAHNIGVSELWIKRGAPELTRDEVLDFYNATYVANGVSAQLANELDVWPRYDDPDTERLATTDIPLLM